MSGDVCAICEGGGGWWQLEPDADTWRLVECEHCDRTGIEPDPGVNRRGAPVNDIIPTAEAAASLAARMKLYRTKLGAVDPFTLLELLDPTVLPLLEAIAAGRVFEVRPERCADCGGEGGGYIDTMFAGEHAEKWKDCPRCDGSGYEPAPPGRKQRTAYDAMIEAAAEGGA